MARIAVPSATSGFPRRGGLAALLLLVATATSPCEPVHAAIPPEALSATWVEVRTPHFRVLSDASEGTASSIARKLEQYVAFLAVAQPALRAVPALPTEVYVFADPALFARYKPAEMENVLGFASEQPGRNVVVMSSEVEGVEKSKVLCHEFTHIFNASNFPDLPVWLNEGLADYYGSFRLHGRNADFGHKLDAAAWWMGQSDLIHFDVLFAFNTRARAYQKDNSLRNTLYAQGWALTHFLHADPSRSAAFQKFLVALREGEKPLRAWEASFPRSEWPALEQALRAYLKDDFFEFRQVPFTPPAESPEKRPASTAAALAALGELELDLASDRAPAAIEHLEAAVERDASLARGWAVLGRAADVAGDTAKAERAYGRALSLAPEDPRVLLAIAMGTFRRATDSESHEAVRLARTRFVACLAADHENPEAQAGVAMTDLMLGQPSNATVAMLAAAAKALPSREHLAANLEVARKALAERPANGAADGSATTTPASGTPSNDAPPDPEEIRLGMQSAAEALRAEKYEEALRRIVGLEARVGPDAGPELRELLQLGRRAAVTGRRRDHALASLRAERFREARDTLQLAVESAPNDLTRESLQSLLSDVKAQLEIQRGLALVKAGKLQEARVAFLKASDTAVSEGLKEHARGFVKQLDAASTGTKR